MSRNKIFQYAQTDAKLSGAEYTIDNLPLEWFMFTSNYSYLLKKQVNGYFLPYIPQNKARVEMKINKKNGILSNTFIKIGRLYATAQKNPAMFETETSSYFLLRTGIGTDILWKNEVVSMSIQANNLLNSTYIDHLSTLREMGYFNMGRNISLNLKISFNVQKNHI